MTITGRTIKLTPDFQVDGVHSKHDGSGRIWYVVQEKDPDDGNRKFCQIYCETVPGTLTAVDHIDKMIGAPHINIRPDGTAYVVGGGRNRTIETGYSIPSFVPLVTTARLAALVTTLEARIVALEGQP